MVLAVAMQATVTQPCGLIASDENIPKQVEKTDWPTPVRLFLCKKQSMKGAPW